MKYVILSPFGIRTGGPEACLQLSDALLKIGAETEIWWTTAEELGEFREYTATQKQIQPLNFPEKEHGFAEYDAYNYRPFTHYLTTDNITFILPEVYLSIIHLFLGNPIIVWWLSVDNAFPSLAGMNMNLLHHKSIRHVAQSFYAEKFLASLKIASEYLTDYTVTRHNETSLIPSEKRPLKIAINAGNKVISDLQHLSTLITQHNRDIEIVLIANMSREDVYTAFKTSRVFIDLGKFPGKDRMVREATLLGCNSIIGKSGAGANNIDFQIDDLYRINVFEYEQIAKLAAHMTLFPEIHSGNFKRINASIQEERKNFNNETLKLVYSAKNTNHEQ